MIEIRHANERGRADFGWLQSRHSFSFGSYYDQDHMGFSALRVINDDRVAPGAGFDTHGHRDMEIISLVTSGVIEHKDSMGNIQRLPKNEFQLMSAGTGVYHSEYNGSSVDDLTFLQIWIVPNKKGGKPGYQQKDFGKSHGLTPVITPSGDNGTLKIRQHTSISQLILAPGESQEIAIQDGRKLYLHQVNGSSAVDDTLLPSGSGAKIANTETVKVFNLGQDNAFLLVFDLP
jgi:redox-sensitive bicupin YhaK (pirin superfamily)